MIDSPDIRPRRRASPPLALLGCLLLPICAVGVFAAVLLGQAGSGLSELLASERQVVRSYYDAVRARDYNKARHYFTTDLNTRLSESDLRQEWQAIERAAGPITKVEIIAVDPLPNNQTNVVVELSQRDQRGVTRLAVRLARESGRWRIADFSG